jgi:uncharacterized protein (TIGR02118 family)
MITLVQRLVRTDEHGHEAFAEWWQGDHADLASDLPGLRWYSTAVPTNPEAVEYDGVLELGFGSTSALEDAFDSAVGQEVMADAAGYVDFEASERMVVDRTVHVDEG